MGVLLTDYSYSNRITEEWDFSGRSNSSKIIFCGIGAGGGIGANTPADPAAQLTLYTNLKKIFFNLENNA